MGIHISNSSYKRLTRVTFNETRRRECILFWGLGRAFAFSPRAFVFYLIWSPEIVLLCTNPNPGNDRFVTLDLLMRRRWRAVYVSVTEIFVISTPLLSLIRTATTLYSISFSFGESMYKYVRISPLINHNLQIFLLSISLRFIYQYSSLHG